MSSLSISFRAKIGEKSYDLVADNENTLIHLLKMTLESISTVSSSQQRWIYKGKLLTDDMTVREANITEGNTVIVMKVSSSNQPNSQTLPSVSNNSFNQSIQNQRSLSTANTSNFDDSMKILLNNSPEIVLNAVTLLLKIISNIVNNPLEEKYRKLNRLNAAFKKKIGDILGGNQCMLGLGFVLNDNDWILIPSEKAWELILACKLKLDKFLSKLEKLNLSGKSNEKPIEDLKEKSNNENDNEKDTIQSPSPLRNPENIIAFQQILQTLASIGLTNGSNINPSAGTGNQESSHETDRVRENDRK